MKIGKLGFSSSLLLTLIGWPSRSLMTGIWIVLISLQYTSTIYWGKVMKHGASFVTLTYIEKLFDKYLFMSNPLNSKVPIFSFIEGLILYSGKEKKMKEGREKWVTLSGVNSITTGKVYSLVCSIYNVWMLITLENLG